MTFRARENWQAVVVLVAAVVGWWSCGGGSPTFSSSELGSVMVSARMEEDAGVDAGTGADAGADAGEDEIVDASVPDGWAKTTNVPGATSLWGTVLAYDTTDKRFILHGGNRYPFGGVMNETWSFAPATRKWRKLDTMGETMPRRYCHCSAFLPAQHQVLIAGGRDDSATVDSAYTLDLTTLTWTKIDGTVPSGAIGCNAEWVPSLGRALVMGGEGFTGVNEKTWAYDPVARTFTELMPTARFGGRRDAMSMIDPMNDHVILFGGAQRLMRTYLNDVRVFDGTTWEAPMLQMTRPSARRYSAAGFDSVKRQFILFGGTNDADEYADLWTMDPLTYQFSQLTLANTPSPRAFSAAGFDPVNGALWIFGGFSPASGDTFIDGYTLKLP